MAKPPNLGTIIAVAKKLLGYFSRTPVKTIVDTPPPLTNRKIQDLMDEAYSWSPTLQGYNPQPGGNRFIDPFNDPPLY